MARTTRASAAAAAAAPSVVKDTIAPTVNVTTLPAVHDSFAPTAKPLATNSTMPAVPVSQGVTTRKAAKINTAAPRRSFKSDGVQDNDVFLLPLSDYYIMFALMGLAIAVRLFRISQPTSVVFDEVQCVEGWLNVVSTFLLHDLHD